MPSMSHEISEPHALVVRLTVVGEHGAEGGGEGDGGEAGPTMQVAVSRLSTCQQRKRTRASQSPRCSPRGPLFTLVTLFTLVIRHIVHASPIASSWQGRTSARVPNCRTRSEYGCHTCSILSGEPVFKSGLELSRGTAAHSMAL